MLWYTILPLSGFSLIRVEQNFTEDGKELEEVHRAVAETRGHFHGWLFSIWKFFSRIILESPNFYTSSIRQIREGIWKGDILITDIDDSEKMDASEMYPRRINAKEELISQKGEEFIFSIADGTAKLPGRDYEFREPTLRREHTVGSEDLSG